jgi:hypothetical protein
MNYKNVEKALNKHLLTVVDESQLQTENDFRTPNSQNFIRSTLLPSQTQVWSIGTSGMVRVNGLFQIDVFTRTNTGTDEARDISDEIVKLFEQARTSASIGYEGIDVVIESAWTGPGSAFQNFYRIPVFVQWSSYQTNAQPNPQQNNGE